MPERVTGIGGIFFKARDKDRLLAWYRDRLGLDVQDWGGARFEWRDARDHSRKGHTVWSLFEQNSDYFGPGAQPFMVNYRVANLERVLDELRREGVTVDDRIEESEFGKFGWVVDPEGNRIELWEPPATGSGGTALPLTHSPQRSLPR